MSKPELIIQDFGGEHNRDLAKTSARLIKGGSWKKQRCVFIIPAADMIPAKVALAYWNLIYPPNQGIVRILAQGLEVGDAYSTAIEQVLVHPELSQWEYIVTGEHDNLWPQDGLLKLLEHMENNPELSWISGCYYTRGEGGVCQIWGDVKDPIVNFRPQPPDLNGGLVRCYGTGMGAAIWRMKMFHDKRLPRPLFRTKSSLQEGVGTQDLSFAVEAGKLGYKCAVACDVRVGHMEVSTGMIW